ncbi:MAG: hypothetical protein IT552_05915 [Sphingomonadaceae bacterium]|nr:hypothetical protein [Sphingomonadaceae bacterium]
MGYVFDLDRLWNGSLVPYRGTIYPNRINPYSALTSDTGEAAAIPAESMLPLARWKRYHRNATNLNAWDAAVENISTIGVSGYCGAR